LFEFIALLEGGEASDSSEDEEEDEDVEVDFDEIDALFVEVLSRYLRYKFWDLNWDEISTNLQP
jgi:hypothetical protein